MCGPGQPIPRDMTGDHQSQAPPTMHRFFVPPSAIQRDLVTLPGPVVHQLTNVLRLQTGERIVVLDDSGWEFTVELLDLRPEQATGRVVDRKESHGQTFLVTDGGMHHQLAASGNFGTVVRRNYPAAIATRFDAPVEEEASIVGCLCTPLDRLSDNAGFPRAEIGDIVAVFCAGAYGASASPSAFLGQGPAKEILV